MLDQERPDATETGDLCRIARGHLSDGIAHMIRESRWFADKDRGPAEFTVVDCGAVRHEGHTIVLVIVEAGFSTGSPSRYFLPLVESPENDGTLINEVGEDFGAWLLHAMASEDLVELESGAITGNRLAEFSSSQLHEQGRASRAEQSNSSILYQTMIAKVYRRLNPGVNPDVEVGTFLAGLKEPVAVPRLLGSLLYRSGGELFTLAMLQEKVDSPVDAWTLLLDALQHNHPLAAAIGEELGSTTGAIHLALSSDASNAAFAPERADASILQDWQGSTRETLSKIRPALASESIHDNPQVGPLANRFLEGESRLLEHLQGYDELAGYPLIRVHGDYHLGQVLRDNLGKWWIVDFEGEPRRPIEQRIRKTSPLKDVAGMLRSFAYARATAQAHGWASQELLAAWENATREDFVESYSATIRAKRDDLLPPGDSELNGALSAWELDKALYEVEYELSSRPDWLWVPLASIVDRLDAL